MKAWQHLMIWAVMAGFMVATPRLQSQTTYSDNFNTNVNFLTNGVAGTIWDGVYFGAGDFNNSGLGGDGPGATVQCDANLTTPGELTLQTTATDWEGTADDGFFLFKVVKGNFSAVVHVVTPFNNVAYNTAGLQARAFSAGGDPFGGSENFVSWTRFDQYSYANYLRNEVNGGVQQINPGDSPNSAYWLRMDRVGNSFRFFQRTNSTDPWKIVSFPSPVNGTNLVRSDLAGQPMQVGLIHATFAGQLGVQFSDFSITATNFDSFSSPPQPVTGLSVSTNGNGGLNVAWSPAAGSSGTLVVVWPSTNGVVQEMPVNGFAYAGNANYGTGDTLAGSGYYVVYSGSGGNAAIANLTPNTTYSVALFSCSGAGNTITYNRNPVTHTIMAPTTPPPPPGSLPLLALPEISGTNVIFGSTNITPGKWYQMQWTASLESPDWQPVSMPVQRAADLVTTLMFSNYLAAPQRFYRVEEFDVPPAGPNLAPNALPETSYVSSWENLYAINDGYLPANSADHSHGAYGNWPQTGTEWVEYDWPEPITTCMIDVYWWQDNAGIYAPASCSLEYWNGSSFVPVSHPSGLGVALNQFNTTTFDPVTTTRLRLLIQSDTAGHSTGILEWRVYDAGGSPTTWPGAPTNSQFVVHTIGGAITSLKRAQDSFPTEYLAGRLGDVTLDYQSGGSSSWTPAQTATLANTGAGTFGWSTNGTEYLASYQITNGTSAALALESDMDFSDTNAIVWTLSITNLTGQPLVIGDLALPLPMNTTYSGVTSSAMKHSYISGSDSFLFWMRPDSVGPYLLMTPDANTHLEYWDVLNGYEVYIHSAVAATNAAAQYPSVTTQGDRWRQPNTSLTLPAGGSTNYGFKFQWADSYKTIRQDLVDNGKIDIHVVPGMTVPTNLFAEVALDTTQTIDSVTAEFPAQTQLQNLDSTNVNGNTYQIYRVQFSKLGENELTINYGGNQTTYLQFFVTEPLETLIKKRAAFLVSHQIITNKWYSGLFCDYNMNDGQLITPDNHDTLDNSFQVYEIASDDAGESRPAYLATKEAVYPVQSEVSALDYYITNFVWGGLQRTTNETDSYGIYGVPDWYTLRSANNLSIGRGYDYPHIIDMYYEMYRVAKDYPEIHTALSADTYLQRAWGTAMAMWSYGGGQATQVGLMNEMVIPNVIGALQAEGMTSQAASLRAKWETKVRYYVDGKANLFASEYAFDATGFESQEAYAKYAALHAGSDPAMGSTNLSLFLQELQQFRVNQITANIFDRGWLETAYYYYGSDYRGDMGDDFVVTYMAQMGGWGLLDYAYNFATNATDYLRLGYASYLCGWSTMNSGPPPNYGFWYPGAANDGGCGGGFEPSPYNTTWLGGQPMHRGPWYYSAEENLGFCGAVREAATILADDPIFGRFCYGGDWTNAADGIEIIPLDGVRQRFHAMLNNGYLHLVLRNDHFAAGQPIVLQPDLSQVNFQIESDNPAAHSVTAHFTPSTAATYTISDVHGVVTTTNLVAGQEAVLSLPMDAGTSPQSFTIAR